MALELRRCALLVALLPIIVLTASCERDTGPLPAVGTLERDRVELVAESSEPIVEIAVAEGAAVTAGQLLLRLDSAVHGAQLAQARAARDRAEQRFAELIRGPRRERILEARARVDGARENLAAQQREHERVETLIERQLASPSQLDQAYARRELAAAEFNEAQAVLAELLEGTTSEELGQAQAALDESTAALSAIEISAARLEVRAPRPGTIEILPYEVGERPPKGATVAVMLTDSAPYARIYVPEGIRSRVMPGLEATIRIDGIQRDYSGTVRFVAAEAAFTPYFALTERDRGRLSYLAEITLTDADAGSLPTGVPVEVEFPSLMRARR
ncbi:MAG TPA: HlyD family efflux transporter periplasmic adaptor subunit [Gammaproteobacteria bacterium]|nr:HlyD family efflux transporter periplasmic adaptor subunit [Gammaproteobacteria bacterium]